jgi:hypothetical protein
MDTHLIQPSDSLKEYTTQHKLLPFCYWVNLTHQDTFIHGPFKFTTVNGRKTWDRISQPDWDLLKAHCDTNCDMFHNPLPQFDVPSYPIHVDCDTHVTFHIDAIACQLIILTPNTYDTPGLLISPWQKVMASQANYPKKIYTPLQRCLFGGMTCWCGPIGHPLCQKAKEVWAHGTLRWIFGILFAF